MTTSSSAWPRERECEKFYGRVGENQTMCKLPFEMVIAWDTGKRIRRFSCHKKVALPLERIFTRTLEHYGETKLKELRLNHFGGCLNVRKKRGSSSLSMHAWGIAVDLDPNNNQLRWGRDKATFARPIYKRFWEFVYDEGAISLGKEANYDWMHFQFARR